MPCFKTSKLSLLALCLCPLSCFALEDNAVEHLLVTGSYAPSSALTSSVSVLEAPEIRALNKRSVAGLLKTLPGLLVEEQGGPGGLTAVSIRGGEANFTLVLLDGVALNDPTNSRGGGFDFSGLSTALIERIEVVRGAQSAVYGSDALAGVINIITRRPSKGHNQQLYIEGGEDEYSDVSFSAHGAAGRLDYAAELDLRDEGEPVEGSTRESDRANLRLGWRLSEAHYLSAAYQYLDGERSSYPEQSGGPLYAVNDDLDQADYENEVLTLGWQANLGDNWRSNLRASRLQRDETYSSPGIAPYSEVPPNAADWELERDDLRWVNTLFAGGPVQFDLGADYRKERGESVGYLEFFSQQLPTDFKLDRETAAVFAGASAAPLEGLQLQGALRYDDPDSYDSETSLSLGASFALGAGFRLATNYGEGFKLPSFFALGHPLVGNPELLPEKSRSLDIGLGWESGAGLDLELTWFAIDFEDLIDFDSETFRNVNRDEVESRGIEFGASWQPSEVLAISAQATYLDLDVKSEPTVLTGRPDWTAGFAGEWRISPRWSTVLDYRWTGEQYAISRHTGEELTVVLDDFHRLDWVLRWQALDALQLQLSIDNLTDEDYQTQVGFPAPGRSLRLGIRFSHFAGGGP
jgi:iron complex outermembrane receptor protein/vitamin B12 transporter